MVGPPGYSVTDLKTMQDWVLERRFKAVPGVIDVTGWGGKTKTYDVTVDQHRLLSYGLSLPQVLQSINNSNVNVGGQTLNIGPAGSDRARRRPRALDAGCAQHGSGLQQWRAHPTARRRDHHRRP